METGQLEATPTAALLRTFADRHATGCLTIRRDEVSAAVYFRGGLVYTASAPEARARLGDRLVGAGHITEEELQATLRRQRSLEHPRRIGELLIEQGLIDRDTMQAYVREQIADSVAVAMGWTQGHWAFDPDRQVQEDAPLDMSVENLLMEGARRLEEWEVIQHRLGSLDAIVDFSPEGSQAELSLTPDEWAMLTRIDGASSVAEIAQEAGYGQFEAARIIYGLLTAGVVTLVEPEPEPYDLDAAPSAALDEFSWDEVVSPDATTEATSGATAGAMAGATYGVTPEEREPVPESALGEPETGFEGLDELADLLSEAGLRDEPPSWPDGDAADQAPAAHTPAHGASHDAPDREAPGREAPDRDAPLYEPSTEAPAAEEPHADETPAEPARTPAAPVDRKQLLREFAALDADEESPGPRPHIDPPPPRAGTRIAPPAPEQKKKGGLFGRFRKE
jgi:hypothetical protein